MDPNEYLLAICVYAAGLAAVAVLGRTAKQYFGRRKQLRLDFRDEKQQTLKAAR